MRDVSPSPSLRSSDLEETGGISICHRRRIERNFTPETFRQRIAEILLHSKYEETDSEQQNFRDPLPEGLRCEIALDRKSTRLNSSHEWKSYAVFCLKK